MEAEYQFVGCFVEIFVALRHQGVVRSSVSAPIVPDVSLRGIREVLLAQNRSTSGLHDTRTEIRHRNTVGHDGCDHLPADAQDPVRSDRRRR